MVQWRALLNSTNLRYSTSQGGLMFTPNDARNNVTESMYQSPCLGSCVDILMFWVLSFFFWFETRCGCVNSNISVSRRLNCVLYRIKQLGSFFRQKWPRFMWYSIDHSWIMEQCFIRTYEQVNIDDAFSHIHNNLSIFEEFPWKECNHRRLNICYKWTNVMFHSFE